MTVLYVALVAIVLAAIPGMFWLRRIGDRSWAVHVTTQTMREAFVQLQVQIRDRFTPALQQMARELEAMRPAFERLAKAMKPPT